MNKKLSINFLSDSPKGWMNKHIERLIKILVKDHFINLVYDENEVQEGDILFILSYYKLVSEKVLKKNSHNIVIHASNLPSGKGWSPATWQILEGRNKIPLSLFEAVRKVDAGPIYLRDTVNLDGTELINEWQDKIGQKINQMVLKFIEVYPKLNGQKQKGLESFYSKRTLEDSQLDVNKTIKEQFNLLRVVDNEKYPAFFIYKGKKYLLKIYRDDT